MHLTILSSFAITALAASVQPHVRRDVTDLSYFTCDSADSVAVCSDKPDTTEYSLEKADQVLSAEGATLSTCPVEDGVQTKPLCCRTYKKSSADLPYANSGFDCTNGNLVTGVGEIVSHTG